MKKLVIIIFSAGLTSSCNTMLETATNNYGNSYDNTYGNSAGYLPTKNQNGETVYVRETPRPTYSPYPIIYPDPIIYPQPYQPPASPPNAVTGQPILYPSAPTDVNSAALSSVGSTKNTNGFLELSRTSGNTHFGIHFAAPINDYFMGRLGASFFNSEELFAGLDLSVRAYLPIDKIRPFAGAGAYYGDTKKCTNAYVNGFPVERCEKKFLGAGYVEVGLEISHFSAPLHAYARS